MSQGPEQPARGDAVRRRRFDDLYIQTYPALMAYAVRRCATRADAEDLVAEIFTVAWRRLDDVPEGDETRPWLFGTARLICMAQFRRNSQERLLLSRLWTMRPPAATAECASEQDPRVRAAFNRLKGADREVLSLTLWEELSAKEVSYVLDISETAVWKRLERARSRLRHQLHQSEPDQTEAAPGGPTRPTPWTVRSST